MPNLRFDPLTYQFYYRCAPEHGAAAKVAGFGWDPLRRRFYTEDPKVAAGLANFGDSYVKLLLADVLDATTSRKRLEHADRSSGWAPRTYGTSISSIVLH
jgi:hypothetical protein